MPVLIAAALLLGLGIGSFLNVVIHRVPAGESLVHPGSHCPKCDAPIRARHNIPVVGWLVLRGRCADCAAPISPRYPLVEAATAILFVAIAVQVARLHLLNALPAYLFFAAAGLALVMIDLDTNRMPAGAIVASYLVLATLLTGASLLEPTPVRLLQAGIGSAAMLVVFFAFVVVNSQTVAIGTIRLAGISGAVLGFLSISALIVGTVVALLVGAAVTVRSQRPRRDRGRRAVPMAPALVGGALVALFASNVVTQTCLTVVHTT
jgi:leader peptidase (prepilin peptidase) / N-methyltransferase